METRIIFVFTASHANISVRCQVIVVTVFFSFAVWFEVKLDAERIICLLYYLSKTPLYVPIGLLEVCMAKQGTIRSKHSSVFINWLFAGVLLSHIGPSFLFVFLFCHHDFIVLLVYGSSLSDLIFKELLQLLHHVVPIEVKFGIGKF